MKTHLQKTEKRRSFIFKSVLMTVIALVWATGVEAQEVQWKKTFASTDVFESVTAVPDGFIAVNNCEEDVFGQGDWEGIEGKGDEDAIVVKYDTAGNIVWKKNFGGHSAEAFVSVTTVPDGFIAAGSSHSVTDPDSSYVGTGDLAGLQGGKYDNDGMIVKYDHNGDVVWKKVSGMKFMDFYRCVSATSDGYVATRDMYYSSSGMYDYDYSYPVIERYGNAGNLIWTKSFGRNNDYYAVTAVHDGIVAVGDADALAFNYNSWEGILCKGGVRDAIIVKYGNPGNILWKKNFGGEGGERFSSVTAASGGFVAVGYSGSYSFGNGDWEDVEQGYGAIDAMIVRFDDNGDVVWKNHFGGIGNSNFESVITVSDGFVAVGYSHNGQLENYVCNAIMVKYDNDGNMVWEKNFRNDSAETQFTSVAELSGSLVAVGNFKTGPSKYNAIIVKYANSGNTDTNEITLSQLSVSAGTLNPAFNPEVYSYPVHVANSVSSIDIMATPTSQGATISGDTGTLPLNVGANPFTLTVTEGERPAQNYTITVYRAGKTGISETETGKINLYPNPVKDELTIENGELTINKITIADLSGKSIQQINGSQKQINVSALSSGIYFVKIETDKGVVTKKFIKE